MSHFFDWKTPVHDMCVSKNTSLYHPLGEHQIKLQITQAWFSSFCVCVLVTTAFLVNTPQAFYLPDLPPFPVTHMNTQPLLLGTPAHTKAERISQVSISCTHLTLS